MQAKIFHASASEVSGDPEVHPQREGYWGHVSPISPRFCCDEGRYCAEALFFDYRRQHGLRTLVRLMDSPDDLAGPVNLGNPGKFTMIELAEAVKNLIGSRSEFVHGLFV